jgi:hypothetical protein
MSNNKDIKETSKRGFALLDKEKQREIARSGGQAAHRKGAAHEFTADEAREAGRKGGLAISSNREHMALIGRSGGRARRGTRANGNGNGHPGNDGASTDRSTQAPEPMSTQVFEQGSTNTQSAPPA